MTVAGQIAGKSNYPEIPEGWVLVPREPTPAMLDAGVLDHAGELSYEDARACYDAMLAASPSSPASGVRVKALDDVAAERQRQMDVEGWTPEHDDKRDHGEMAYAAACYALATRLGFASGWLRSIVERLWPWDVSWWKPTTPRRNLVKAGALIVADIERLDRRSALGEHP